LEQVREANHTTPPESPTVQSFEEEALAYESSEVEPRVGESWWGVASYNVCRLNLLLTVGCTLGALVVKPKALELIGLALYCNWIGCGVGAVLGLIGVLQRGRGRRLAAHGLWMSFGLLLAPVAMLGLLFVPLAVRGR
jgi:hypothetical protein